MTDDTPDADQSSTPRVERGRVRPAAVVFGLLVLSAGAFGLYEMVRPPSKVAAAHAGACAKSLDLAGAIGPLVHGEVAALMVASRANDLGALAFDDAEGHKTTVASFKKPILLNLWATWCVPCRTEMPALDRLQGALGAKDFSVVPINIDTTRLDRAKDFFKDIQATKLPYYSDKSADILQVLKQSQRIDGLPTTILIGADGCEIATMAGPAQWDSPEAKALIEKVRAAEPGRGGAA